MSDVFVSYSRRDIELVSRLCDGLGNRGKTVFVDVGDRLDALARTPAGAGAAEPPLTQTAAVATTVVEPGAAVPGVAVPSAASPGAAAAEDLAAERERAEISGIPPSAKWMDEIRAAIADADNIVVVISPDSCSSAVCRTELDYAVELNKRLVPVIVRDTSPDLVPDFLGSLNWLPINAGESFESDVDRLVERLSQST